MAYAVKPAVVRVNAYATGELVVSAELVEAATRVQGVPNLEPQSDLIVSTGAGSSGSGFIVHPDGLIVTSAHVVAQPPSEEQVALQLRFNGALAVLTSLIPEDEIGALQRSGELERLARRIGEGAELRGVEIRRTVDLSNGERFPFEIRAISPPFDDGGNDLALLKISRRNLPTLRLAPPRDANLQGSVWIAGYPAVASTSDSSIGAWLSRDTDLEATFTSGSITAQRNSRNGTPLLQTDAEVYPGNSGGPAVDESGEVIGVPTWGHAEAGSIRFLVAVGPVRDLLEGAGIEINQESEFDAVWDEALASASRGDWRSARRSLDAADALFSGSPDLARLRADATLALEEASVEFPRIAIVSLLLVGAGIFAARRLYRYVRHHRPLPVSYVEEIRLLPAGGAMLQETESGANGLGSFTILNGERAGVRFALGGPGIRIGRDARICELVLENPKVSRLHAEVVKLDGRTMLIDRNSSNGTWVNDERVEKVLLADGDIIYFGGRHAVAAAFRREERSA